MKIIVFSEECLKAYTKSLLLPPHTIQFFDSLLEHYGMTYAEFFCQVFNLEYLAHYCRMTTGTCMEYEHEVLLEFAKALEHIPSPDSNRLFSFDPLDAIYHHTKDYCNNEGFANVFYDDMFTMVDALIDPGNGSRKEVDVYSEVVEDMARIIRAVVDMIEVHFLYQSDNASSIYIAVHHINNSLTMFVRQ